MEQAGNEDPEDRVPKESFTKLLSARDIYGNPHLSSARAGSIAGLERNAAMMFQATRRF